ncbi:SGNH/GDSL hydrolase family protein [Cystobacter fuscus]
MKQTLRLPFISVFLVLATAVLGCENDMQLEQNSNWTIERASHLPTYKIVAYGDSIFSGLVNVSLNPDDRDLRIARRAAPYVAGEYLSQRWDANIQVMRRTTSGAKADEVYARIVNESARMQTPDTRVVMFEMCGTNYLLARSHLSKQTGTCNYRELDDALAQCTQHMENAMLHIRDNAYSGVKAKIIMNLYYPGYAANDVLTSCQDAATGQPVNKQDKFLPILARSNWRACHLAGQYGFQCVDAFAAMMGAEDDSNEDGVVDSEALRYVEGETEDDYVTRITVTLRDTLRDPNHHRIAEGTEVHYLSKDNTHPTRYGNAVWLGLQTYFIGSHEPDFADSQLLDGKNPMWNLHGHERLGWSSPRPFKPTSPERAASPLEATCPPRRGSGIRGLRHPPRLPPRVGWTR